MWARLGLEADIWGYRLPLVQEEPRKGLERDGGRWREMAGDGERWWEMAEGSMAAFVALHYMLNPILEMTA